MDTRKRHEEEKESFLSERIFGKDFVDTAGRRKKRSNGQIYSPRNPKKSYIYTYLYVEDMRAHCTHHHRVTILKKIWSTQTAIHTHTYMHTTTRRGEERTRRIESTQKGAQERGVYIWTCTHACYTNNTTLFCVHHNNTNRQKRAHIYIIMIRRGVRIRRRVRGYTRGYYNYATVYSETPANPSRPR